MHRTLLLLAFTPLAAGVLAAEEPSPGPANAAAVCAEATASEAELKKSLPLQVDDITILSDLTVDCAHQTITYTKRLKVDPALLGDGWIAREQRRHTDLHCKSNGLSKGSGWTAKDTLLGPDYRHAVTLVTRPSDCPIP